MVIEVKRGFIIGKFFLEWNRFSNNYINQNTGVQNLLVLEFIVPK